ncbi:MAG: hypothetical protein EXR95_03480 [Gemmatimonadetes bacterium]|nr:hypothetical protein [Gemmatimonadota bacterium]
MVAGTAERTRRAHDGGVGERGVRAAPQLPAASRAYPRPRAHLLLQSRDQERSLSQGQDRQGVRSHRRPRLARRGTLIVADNVIRSGDVLDEHSTDPSVIGVRRFNQALAAEPRVAAVLLQTVGVRGHDGMALAVVR